MRDEISSDSVTRQKDWWIEFAATLLLGLAAVGAGWAAYQAARWSGEQLFALNRSTALGRNAAALQNKAYLLRVVDVGMFTMYLQAIAQNQKMAAQFLFERFRPPLKTATEAWLATNPLQNPKAPRTPFIMEQYRLPEDQQALRGEQQAEEQIKKAQVANERSDNYVLMTVPFAVVSLFSGISTKFLQAGMRTMIVIMAFVIFVVAAVTLAFMPVA